MQEIFKRLLTDYAGLITLLRDMGLGAIALPSAEALQLPSASQMQPADLEGIITKAAAPKLIKISKAKKAPGYKSTGNGTSNAKILDLCDAGIKPGYFSNTKPKRAVMLIGIDNKEPKTFTIKTKSWARIFLGVISTLAGAGLSLSEMAEIPGLGKYGFVPVDSHTKFVKIRNDQAIALANGRMLMPQIFSIGDKKFAYSGVQTTETKINFIRKARELASANNISFEIEVELS
jgi:hypothetical protein